MESTAADNRSDHPVIVSALLDPPTAWHGMLRQIGPGLIMAGSIVGSGELIMTTKTGAGSGFVLLWLIILGCGIKTFTQIELGRYTITWSRTTLESLNQVPGPRARVNWIVWYWVVLTMLILTQQGGIVGGIGQALAAVVPITRYGAEYDQWQTEKVQAQVTLAQLSSSRVQERTGSPSSNTTELRDRAEEDHRAATHWLDARQKTPPWDAYLWAVIVAAPTSVCLFFGHYRLVQSVSMVLVMSFTVVTLGTVFLLQLQPAWAVTAEEVRQGLQFHLPVPTANAPNPILTAFATFGLIGVGSGELLQYPYWCLEKGYARYVGPRDDSPAWLDRAAGWLRVLHVDAWCSMVLFTLSTVAFYLLGAAVLWRSGLNPAAGDMVKTLTAMYVPVFGSWAPSVFLFGAFAVLYSTFFVSSASNALLIADGLGMLGLSVATDTARRRRARWISALWPWLAVGLYWGYNAPDQMIRMCGIGQTLMLPMLGGAALWFRYRRSDPRLVSGWWFDLGLWASLVGFVAASIVTLWASLKPG